MKRILLIILIFPTCLLAAFGPDVSRLDGKDLKWEDGAYGYHVMFKSLLENSNPDGVNPHADTCIDELTGSTYTLDSTHIPDNSRIEKAFLIWTGAVPEAEIDNLTDNDVFLNFTSTDGQISHNETITVGKAYKLTESADFEFDGFKDAENPTHGYFTYRVDVTEFFENIHEQGRALGFEYDGYSLYGDYTVSGLTCASDSSYVESAEMVSVWSLVVIYTSSDISIKNVYFYDGFKPYLYEVNEIDVTGFKFPTNPKIKLTLISHLGDSHIASVTNSTGGLAPPEGIQVQGEQVGWILISNDCNYEAMRSDGISTLFYSEVYNSISSVYGWADTEVTCIGGTPPELDLQNIEYAMDVDTFLMDSNYDGAIASHFHKGGERVGLKIGVNKDFVIINTLIVSVDTQASKFDIPVNDDTPTGRENIYCGCSTQSDAVCFDYPFYYAVKIQNWGNDLSVNVTLQNILSPKVAYVSGTTQICKEWKSEGGCSKWEKIEDDSGGSFPLAQPYKIADSLAACNKDTSECPETIMVRFKVKPSDVLHENDVIENTAFISDNSGKVYRTNTAIPLRLVSGSCPSVSECENPDLADCGGDTGGDIGDDSDVDDTGNTGDDSDVDDIGDTGDTADDSDLGNTGNNSDTEDAEHDSDMEDTENTGDDSDVDDIGDTGDTADDSDLGNTGDIGNTAEKPSAKSSGCSVLLF